MALVFQYGSNTLKSRLNSAERLNGSAKFVSVVRTSKEYRFAFTVWSKKNDCAAADIIEGGDNQILGVLYDIPDNKVFRDKCLKNSKCLDKIEGEGFNYQRIKIDIEDLTGNKIDDEVFTYVVNTDRRDFSIMTSLQYVSYIITGLESVDIPTEYIEYVKMVAKLNNSAIEI